MGYFTDMPVRAARWCLGGMERTAPRNSCFTPNTPDTPDRPNTRKREREPFPMERVGCVGCVGCAPACTPWRCRAAAAARVRRRRPSQPRQRSTTTYVGRQPAIHDVQRRCSTRQGTRRACVDLHRTGERSAAASASPQPEHCSPSAKCMRARARCACCSPSLH